MVHDAHSIPYKTCIQFQYFILLQLRPEGGVEGLKVPILIFQYVIELEETNQMQKTGGYSTFPSRDNAP